MTTVEPHSKKLVPFQVIIAVLSKSLDLFKLSSFLELSFIPSQPI